MLGLKKPLPTMIRPSAGFSLAFAPSLDGLGIVGGFDYVFFNGVGMEPNEAFYGANGVPFVLFATFQMMFAAITPALISGAFAERKRFKAFVLFALLWSLLVYSPVCHWVWGQGGWMAKMGVMDFAGTYNTTAWKSVQPWFKVEVYNLLNNQKQIAWDKTISVNAASALDANGIPYDHVDETSLYFRGPDGERLELIVLKSRFDFPPILGRYAAPDLAAGAPPGAAAPPRRGPGACGLPPAPPRTGPGSPPRAAGAGFPAGSLPRPWPAPPRSRSASAPGQPPHRVWAAGRRCARTRHARSADTPRQPPPARRHQPGSAPPQPRTRPPASGNEAGTTGIGRMHSAVSRRLFPV